MNILADIQKQAIKRVPVIKPGYTVRVHQKIKEGEKQRIQIFEGLVIKVNSGFGADRTFTVRKVVGGIGVEKIFPLYSTNIEKIEVKKKSKVRRAKLYYMRDRFGKSARLKDTFVNEQEYEKYIEEAVEAAEEAQAEEATAQTEETATTEQAAAPAEAPAAEEPKAEAAPAPAEEKKEEKAEEAPAEEAKTEEAPKEEPEAKEE